MFVFDPTRWELWLIASVGLACGAFALLLGRTAFTGRRRPGHKRESRPEKEADLPAASSLERRESSRRRGRVVLLYVTDAEASAAPLEGWIMDRSTDGLCIALAQQIPVGTMISVRPNEAPITAPWVQAEVRNCRLGPNGWEHGCAFVRTPDWGVLLHFG